MSSFTAIVAVFLGGGIGAVLRFGTTQGMLAAGIAQRLHWATFAINIMASLLWPNIIKLSPEKVHFNCYWQQEFVAGGQRLTFIYGQFVDPRR